jgi:hypothetical protein
VTDDDEEMFIVGTQTVRARVMGRGDIAHMAFSTTGHGDEPAGSLHPFTVVGIGASAGGLKAGSGR